MGKIETFSDRKFALLLYPEDKTHVEALERIKRSFDYAVILHDKDLDENEEIKKAHWHVVVTVGTNKRWNTALAKELGIEMNYIEKIRNLDRALEYLIHLNDSDKYQYSIDAVEGTLKTRLTASMNSSDKTENEVIAEIIEFIEIQQYKISYTYFAKYCASNGFWDVYRRAGAIINKIIEEHNADVDKENKMLLQERKRLREGFENIEDTNYDECCPFESEGNNE